MNTFDKESENPSLSDTSAMVIDEMCTPAWDAYNEMFQTKKRHYDFLEMLDGKKKKFNLDPTQAESEKLATLLAEHDQQVKLFTTESMSLKASNPDAHKTLFQYIAQIAEGDGDRGVQH